MSQGGDLLQTSDASRREIVLVCLHLPSLRANGSRECAPDDRLPRSNPSNGKKKEWIASLRSQ
jgi:hypothetical protein